MHLVEVLMAGSVFAIASGTSVQLWSATTVGAHQLSARAELEQQIEQDRLQLQSAWRSTWQSASATSSTTQADSPGCNASPEQLMSLGASLPPPTGLRRELRLNADGQAVEIHWSAAADPGVQRVRLASPAGLGLCGLPPEPQPTDAALLTDSQVEGVSP